jgi:hypothetical protein
MENTFAPLSVAEATIFGVLISVKRRASSALRKPAWDAAATRNSERRRDGEARGGQVENGRQPIAQDRPIQVERGSFDRGGQDLHRGIDDLDSIGCLVVGNRHPGDLEDGFLNQSVKDISPPLVDDDLREPRSIP